MESFRSGPLAVALVVLAAAFAVLGVLYAAGAIQVLTSNATPGTHHYTHAVLFAVLTVAALVAANLARPKPA